MAKRPGCLLVLPWIATPVGGIDQVVLNLYRKFEDADDFLPQILVTSWPHVQPLTTIEHGRSIAYMRVRSPVAPGAPLTSSAKWAFLLMPEISRIGKFIRSNNIAAVNIHCPSLAAVQFVLARTLLALRFRVVLSFHGQDLVLATTAVGLEGKIWRLLLRRADAIVACSAALADSAKALERDIGRRFTVIHNGIDIDHLMHARNPAARLEPRLAGRSFILSVAAYEPKKGLDTLIRALSAIRTDRGRDVMLCLVGREGGMGDELRRLARNLGVADHVVFCGEVLHANLHAYYEAATVFCLPSRAEPFGIVILEAGAFRCPVVATMAGGVPEILEDGVNSRLVPPEDPAAMAAALDALLSDRAERDRLSKALFEHVRTCFPWRSAYDSYVKLLRQQ
ncbi:MAG TPA: glycosyltransferase family 4 protein [Casimicrobiaceae bacterium]|nr:glycosyltransferase family 4 protein [Casimicrobiaceae bacterium]